MCGFAQSSRVESRGCQLLREPGSHNHQHDQRHQDVDDTAQQFAARPAAVRLHTYHRSRRDCAERCQSPADHKSGARRAAQRPYRLGPAGSGAVPLRLPNTWNGRLVVAGASGTRSEFNGDVAWSDLDEFLVHPDLVWFYPVSHHEPSHRCPPSVHGNRSVSAATIPWILAVRKPIGTIDAMAYTDARIAAIAAEQFPRMGSRPPASTRCAAPPGSRSAPCTSASAARMR